MTSLVGALGPQIADVLRQEIVTGAVPSGVRLVEADLASRFDVSRGPIRDAIKELAADNLVEIRRRSVFAVGISEPDVDEIYSLRLAIEALATRRLVGRRPLVDWSGFERSIAAMQAAADADDAAAFGKADLEFHEAVYRAAGHRRLLAAWSQLAPTLRALLRGNARDRDLRPSVEVHETFLALMRSAPVDDVLRGLEDHLAAARARFSRAIDPVALPDDPTGRGAAQDD